MIASNGDRSVRKGALALGFVLVALLLAGSLTERSAHALPILYVVDTTADDGNGICSASGCTLREAIDAANDSPEKDAIHFDIPGGSGVKTIKPDSPLPTITDPVTVDGYTQPGAQPNELAKGTNAKLKIQLNGENAGIFADGLSISATDSVIRGLVINRFDEGVKVGSSPADPDVPPQRTRVEGNFIGTDPSGTVDRGNSGRGVFVFGNGGDDNTIGGATPQARNLISGNDGRGVYIKSNNNEIEGNLIGTKKDGTSALGNSASGVHISGAGFQNVVGGGNAGAANIIAFNSGDGVTVCCETFTYHNVIARNSIFGNIDLFPDGLGIDLAEDGPTPNDPDDADSGPNNLQNFPILNSAENSGNETTIKGSLNSKPGKKFVLRFFSNPPGSSEGKTFIGQKSVTTNQHGNVSFTFKPENKVAVGRNITATAMRNSTGDTSEFSTARVVAV